MGKNKHFKLMDFLNILGEAEIHTIPKIWEKQIYIVRKKYGKIQTFQSYGFLNISREAEIHTISKTWEKQISLVWKKVWENT